jgi:hypothetical protein
MMNTVEEEKKESPEIKFVLAEPEEMGEMLINTIIPLNMINDLNVAIDNLRYLTTDIEKEDS